MKKSEINRAFEEIDNVPIKELVLARNEEFLELKENIRLIIEQLQEKCDPNDHESLAKLSFFKKASEHLEGFNHFKAGYDYAMSISKKHEP